MVVCLSPHPDDAVLSCGGLLAMLRDQGRPASVVTVFAGSPPPDGDLSPSALLLHHSWGGLPDPMAHRRAEDTRALEVLGCPGLWWDYLDAIYRHPAYNSLERLFGTPVEEIALEEELYGRCAALPGQVLLFPLAVGHHVDHQMLFRVGWALGQAGRQVGFYEDQPYVAWEGGPQPRLAGLGRPLYPQVLEITPHWPTKVTAVSCYSSQFAELTRDGVSLLEALERYASVQLAGAYVERLWWPGEGRWI